MMENEAGKIEEDRNDKAFEWVIEDPLEEEIKGIIKNLKTISVQDTMA